MAKKAVKVKVKTKVKPAVKAPASAAPKPRAKAKAKLKTKTATKSKTAPKGKEKKNGKGKPGQASKVAPPPSPPSWFLYVLLCADGTLYCGITTDLAKRLEKHTKGLGARYTRGRSPLTLLRSWPHETMSAALKAEAAFKSLSRRAKDARLAAQD